MTAPYLAPAPADAPLITGLLPGMVTPEAIGLSSARTVSRRLVHKSAVHEVLLSDSRQIAETKFTLAAQVPVVHAFYADRHAPHHDMMLLVELVRQTGILLAHEYHGIPFGYQFVFLGLEFAIRDLAATRVRERAADAVLVVETFDRQERDDALAGYWIDVAIFIDGAEAARAKAGVTFVPPPAYRALRTKVRAGRALDGAAAAPVVPAAPRSCGRHDPRNVVISALRAAEQPWQAEASVVVDDAHPCLFDHELDHVPGMLLLEAAKQVAVATVADRVGVQARGVVPVSCKAKFTCFAELELPLACRARLEPGDDDPLMVRTVLEQPDAQVCECSVSVVVDRERGR